MQVNSNLQPNNSSAPLSSQLQLRGYSLPGEIVDIIFSHLNDQNVLSASQTNQAFRANAINYSIGVNNSLVYFADFLSKKLADLTQRPESEEMKKWLININEINTDPDISNTGLVNLSIIRYTITPKLKNEIFNKLKNLKIDELILLKPHVEEYIRKHENLSQFEGVFEDVDTYKSELYEKLEQDFRKASSLRNVYKKGSCLQKISKGFLDWGDTKRALEVARAISDDCDIDKSEALLSISKELYESGETKEAQKLLNEAFLKGSHNPAMDPTALTKISKEFFKRGDVDKAIEAAEAIPIPGYSIESLIQISKKLFKSGETDRVLELQDKALGKVKTMYSHEEQSHSLIKLSDLFIEIGKGSTAREMLNKALKSARAIPDDDNNMKVHDLSKIATQYFKLEEIKEAQKLLKEALKLTENISYDFFKYESLEDIIKSLKNASDQYFKSEDISEAKKLLKEAIKVADIIDSYSDKKDISKQISDCQHIFKQKEKVMT